MTRQSQRTFVFGPFCLDVAEQRLLREGRAVPLTPKIFELLRVLVEDAGHLVEKDRLLKEVWSDTFVEEANLNRGIFVLRKTLGKTPAERYIETVPKRGYRFVAPVRAHDNEAAGSGQSVGLAPVVEPHNVAEAWITRRRSMLSLGIAVAAVLTSAALMYAVLIRSKPNEPVNSKPASIHRQLTFTGKELTPALSPDGRLVAYVSNRSPHRRVMVQQLTGGVAVEVFKAPEIGQLRWSPVSSELLFRARGGGTDGLYIATPSGGSARRIAAGGAFVAGWSPDGSTIAVALFVSGKILFLNRVGEGQRTIPLSGTRDWIWDLDWSSINGRLLFVADDDQRRPAIWTIRPDGSDQTKVLTATTEILAARWAPAGDAFYYFRRVNQTVSLYKASLERHRTRADLAPTPLISGLESDEGFGLSADGTRLVYARAPYYSNLWLIEAVVLAGGRQIRQTQLTQGTSVIERPRVSPDGQSILFNMGYESRANLYTIPATGGTPRQLTFMNAFSLGGVWSPDGRLVAFASNEGGKARVWVVNADGSSPHPLPAGDLSDSFEMTWAPGDRLLYQQTANRNYYLIDSQTRQPGLLVKDSSVGWLSSPAYSPDGKRIAVSWNRRPVRGLYLIDSKNLDETLIHGASNPSDSVPFPIGWSPDGKFIYAFDGKRAAYRGVSVPFEETTTETRILRVSLNGGRPETILTLPFEEIGSVTMFPDGRRFVCTVYSSRSDVWIVEDFDVSSRSRLARR